MKTKFLYIAIGLLLGSTAVAQSWSWNWNYCNTDCEDPTGQVDTELRDGSKEKPYTISSAQELANFCAYVNTKTAGDAYYGKYVVYAPISCSTRTCSTHGRQILNIKL